MNKVAEPAKAEEVQPLGTYADDVVSVALSVTPAHDKLFCECTVLPEKSAEHVTVTTLEALINPHVAKDLISEEVLADIVSQLRAGKPPSRRRIAQAIPMTPGRDGKLLVMVKKFVGFQGHVAQDIIDQRFLRHFDNVEVGAIIGRIYPPTPGKAGRDVLGKPIEPPPVHSPKTQIDTATISTDPHKGVPAWDDLVARVAGYVGDVGGKLAIVTTLEIKQNVDYRVGDIDFVANLRIRGELRTGFTIRARESITVDGDCYGASLHCPRGQITIKGHVSGSDSTTLSSAELVLSNMIETSSKSPATIVATGDINLHSADGMIIEGGSGLIVNKEIRNCLARVRSGIIMPQGHLLDSEVFTVCGVEAGTIGSEAGSRTVINLVSDIEATHEYADLAKRLEENLNAQEMIRLYLGPFATHSVSEAKLKPDHRAKLHELRKKLTKLEQTEKELFQEQTRLLQNAKHNRTYRVSFKKALYAGTEIRAAGETYLVSETQRGPGTVEFNPETSAFDKKDFAAIECDLK